MFENKTVVLGVTGGIAVYKALDLTSRLGKLGINVKVIMTKSAAEFVSPLSFQSLSKNPVAVDMFEEPKSWEIRHISLAKAADVFAVVPCTANVIGKIAGGIADDMLTTTVMATKAPVLIAPAMNTNMYENPIVQDNINKLKSFPNYSFVMPESGMLACGDVGNGKLANVGTILDAIVRLLALQIKSDLTGKKVLVSAGATIEKIDPVRYITNHSTGKMGFSIAKSAMLRGADVTLIAGKNACKPINNVKQINVESAVEMENAMNAEAVDADIIIMSAAVSDFRAENISDEKIKKGDSESITISLVRNPDILKNLGSKYAVSKTIVGFAMETKDLVKNAKEKCKSKNADFIVANNLKTKGAGFGTDTNVVTIIDKDGGCTEYPIMSKDDIADIILDKARDIKK